ncbi:MAG: hypothetical protein ACREC4_02735 [Methylocella sp.]
MPASMTIEQKIPYTVFYMTAAGKPAKVDGPPVATISDASLATVAAEPDGMSGFVIAAGVGDVTVTITADADLGTGVTPIVLSDVVTITPAGAATGTFGFGAPVPQ